MATSRTAGAALFLLSVALPAARDLFAQGCGPAPAPVFDLPPAMATLDDIYRSGFNLEEPWNWIWPDHEWKSQGRPGDTPARATERTRAFAYARLRVWRDQMHRAVGFRWKVIQMEAEEATQATRDPKRKRAINDYVTRVHPVITCLNSEIDAAYEAAVKDVHRFITTQPSS